MNKLRFIILLILLILQYSCISQLTETPVLSTIDVSTEYTVPTATKEAPYEIVSTCITPLPIKEINDIDAKLLMQNMISESPPQWLFDLSTGEKHSINSSVLSTGYSVDHDEYAYIDNNDKLSIIRSDGTIISQFKLPGKYIRVLRWIDENRYLLERKVSDNPGIIRTGQSIYDVQNSTVIDLPYDLPNIDPMIIGGPRWDQYSSSITIYNNDFKKLVYLASIDNDYPLILWDTSKNSEVKVLHNYMYDSGGGPKWVSSGTTFFITIPPSFSDWTGKKYVNDTNNNPYYGGAEIYSVTEYGSINRLTYFTTKYLAAEEGMSLSSDESRIAFWLNFNYQFRDRQPKTHLAILDLSNNQIEYYCLAGGDYPLTPVWSPSGDYLIVSISDYSINTTQSFLLNLSNNEILQLPVNGYVFGWLINPRENK